MRSILDSAAAVVMLDPSICQAGERRVWVIVVAFAGIGYDGLNRIAGGCSSCEIRDHDSNLRLNFLYCVNVFCHSEQSNESPAL